MRLEHVISAFQFHPHLVELLQGFGKTLHRLGKLGKVTLEGEHHPDGKLPLHDQPDPDHQDERIRRSGSEGGHHAETRGIISCTRPLGVRLGLVVGPCPEEAVFGPRRLDRLDHLDTRQGRSREIGLIAGPHPGHIGPFTRDCPDRNDIHRNGSKADQREQGRVAHHDDSIDRHHQHVHAQRGD